MSEYANHQSITDSMNDSSNESERRGVPCNNRPNLKKIPSLNPNTPTLSPPLSSLRLPRSLPYRLLQQTPHSTSNISPCSSGLYSFTSISEKARMLSNPRTSSVSCGTSKMWKSANRSNTCAMYLSCMRRRAMHFRHAQSLSGNTTCHRCHAPCLPG